MVPRYFEDLRGANSPMPWGVQSQTLVPLHYQSLGLAWMFGVREDLVPWVPRHSEGGLGCIPLG